MKGNKPISREGYEKLKISLEKTIKEREIILLEVSEAREKGDLKENAEYKAARERQFALERQIDELTTKLYNYQIVDFSKISKDKISFGATVKMKNDGNVRVYTVVSEEEVDGEKGYISVESPIGKGILGKKVGEKFSILTPSGKREIEILEILYDN